LNPVTLLQKYQELLLQGFQVLAKDPAWPKACEQFENLRRKKGNLFLAGNGGSAANANPLAADLIYGVNLQGRGAFRVHSLAANPSVAEELRTGKSVSGKPVHFTSGYEHWLKYGKAQGWPFPGDYQGYTTAAALASASQQGGPGGTSGATTGNTANTVSDSNTANSITGLAAPANSSISVSDAVASPADAPAATDGSPDGGPSGDGTGGEARGGLMPDGRYRLANGGMPSYAMGGGLGSLGSYSDGGRLLKGPGDGVSDSIPATIGAKQQPARLADGEFVVPARIVSELGNGSTEAGAKKLYAMMDRVQRARGKTTGKNKVAANSRADKYLPA
jgi:hypothetical protein